ncbi:MAG: hypothetical protein M1839_006369 [Geoglossum umbratile]|nr:MAG: hypothetical protein M1839_006369 [Geoglossum umbratile]
MVLKPLAVAGNTTKPKSDAGTGVPADPAPLYEAMQQTAMRITETHANTPIFHVDLGDNSEIVSDVFISNLPVDEQRLFNCSVCKHFMKNWGNLATVDPDTGSLVPFFWNTAEPNTTETAMVPPYYHDAVEGIAKLFVGKKVRDEFKVTEKTKVIGHAEAGGYAHMHFEFQSKKVEPESPPGFSQPDTVTLAQMLGRILEDYNLDTVQKAAHLLLDDKLSYADKHKGAIRYLRNLMESGTLTRRTIKGTEHHNLLYHHAASSFLGCLHALRSGAVSNLLEWVEGDLTFDAIQDAWNHVAGPANYMRPSAAPSAGNIAAAEKLMSNLKITKSDMEREFLAVDQIPASAFVWRCPVPPSAVTPGIFAQVVPKASTKSPKDTALDTPATPMTFAKFATTVLPKATKVEYLVPKTASAYFFITGHPGTQPLMQWHTEENLASWYTFVNPNPYEVSKYNLKPGWTPVPCIVSFPHLWNDLPVSHGYASSDQADKKFKYNSHGTRYLICIEGIRDKTGTHGYMLFPTLLRRELHGVRSTIEAFSNGGVIPEKPEAVGGFEVAKGNTREMNHTVRVTDEKGRTDKYRIILFD